MSIQEVYLVLDVQCPKLLKLYLKLLMTASVLYLEESMITIRGV